MTGNEAALTQGSSAALKKTIDTSVGFFRGGDGKRTREIEIDRAPAPVAAKLQSAYNAMVADLSDWGDESELDKGIYEIFKTSKKKTVIGYAIWVYGDNGDAGRGLVRGFDLDGKQIYDEEGSWGED
jgi:hypothetical protein